MKFLFYIILTVILSVATFGQTTQKVNLDQMNVEGEQKEVLETEEIDDEEDQLEAQKPKEKVLSAPTESKPAPEVETSEIPEDEELETKDPEPLPKKALFKTKSKWKNFFLGVGAIDPENGGHQKSGSGGKTSRFWKTNFKFGIEFSSQNFGVTPYIHTSLHENSEDELSRKLYSGVGLKFFHNLNKFVYLTFGSNLFVTTISNFESGRVDLPGSQGTFFANKNPRFLIRNTVDFGLEVRVKNFGIEFQTLTLSMFKNEDRGQVFQFFINYYFKSKQ